MLQLDQKESEKMSYYDDYYREPSEFDMMVEEFKESLASSIKEEHVKEMERLRKENQELRVVKTNFESIKIDYEKKKRELEYEYQSLKDTVRRERLSELMKDYEVEFFTVGSSNKRRYPKCDKCNDNRKIPYTTPLGRATYESCDCDKHVSVYKPMSILLRTFSIRNGEGNAWYKMRYEGTNDEFLEHYEDNISGDELITDESQFKDIGYAYRTLFKTEELAQKYCDYKNRISMEE